MKFYCLFPGDFMRDTMTLTPYEVGLYIRLLNHQYTTEKPIADLAEASKICGIRVQKGAKKIPKLLQKYFKSTEQGWINPRFKKELKRLKSISKKRQEAAFTRYRKHANAVQVQQSCTDIPHPHIKPSSFLTSSQDQKGLPLHNNPPEIFVPPVPAALWSAFREMRKKIRKPMTDHAANLIVRKLERLQTAGEDAVAVVEQSIRNGWQDVFAVRNEGANHERPSKEQQRFQRSQRGIEQAFGSGSRLVEHLQRDVPRRNLAGTGTGLLGNAETHSADPATPSVHGSREKK